MYSESYQSAIKTQVELDREIYLQCASDKYDLIQNLLNSGADPLREFSREEISSMRSEAAARDGASIKIAGATHLEESFSAFFLPPRNKFPPTVLHRATHLGCVDVVELILSRNLVARPILSEILEISISTKNNDLTTRLLEKFGLEILTAAAIQQACAKSSMPVLEALFKTGEDISGLASIVLEAAIQNGAASALKIFRKNKIEFEPTLNQWKTAISNGSMDLLRELVTSSKILKEYKVPIIRNAIARGEVDRVSLLIAAGLGEESLFYLPDHLQNTEKQALSTFLSLARYITNTDALASTQIEEVLGLSRRELVARAVDCKDLFTTRENISLRQNPFIRVALRAAYLAAVISPDDEATAKLQMRSLLQNDVARISSTKGLSWERYARSIDQESVLESHLPEVVRDLTDAILLPTWVYLNNHVLVGEAQAERGRPLANHLHDFDFEPYANRGDKILEEKRQHFESCAGSLYLRGKSTLCVTLLSRRWLKEVNEITVELRRGKVGLEWNALFDPVVLSNGMRAVCLTSTAQLVDEGNALQHCVGLGGYDRGCATGAKQIISIRDANNRSLATLELSITHLRSEIPLGMGRFGKVLQFQGERNSKPEINAKLAWDEVVGKVVAGKIKCNSSLGMSEDSKLKLSDQPFYRSFGYMREKVGEVVPQLFERYSEISHDAKGGYAVKFLDPSLRELFLSELE